MARDRGILVNAVQAGGARDTERVWRDIAQMGHGEYIPIPQDGGHLVVIETPYDIEIIELQSRINGTVIPYGPREQRGSVEKKTRQAAAAPRSVATEMAGYMSRNAAKTAGEAITGAGDLVSDVKAGRQKLAAVKDDELPDQVRHMNAAERSAFIDKQSAERKALNERMAELVKQRDRFVLDSAKKAPTRSRRFLRPRGGGNAEARRSSARLAIAGRLPQSPAGANRRGKPPERERPMPAIDYEKEYDNRARVPEHPEIFARWHRDAAAYRAAARRRRARPRLRPLAAPDHRSVPGQGRRQPRSPCSSTAAGGARSTRRNSARRAAGLNAHGVSVAVVGYDLCPQVTIATIIDQMRTACLYLWRKQRKRILAIGHSAGGHLAACMVATDWKTLAPDAPADLVPAGYAISGAFDLSPLPQISVNQDLRLDDAEALALSPVHWQVPRRPHARCGGGRAGVERIPAPEPIDRRCVAQRAASRRVTRRSPAPTTSP